MLLHHADDIPWCPDVPCIQKDTDLDYADYAGGCSFCCVVVFCPGIYTKNRFQWGRCCRVDGSDALQTDQHFIFSSCLVSHHDNIREHTYACTAPHSVLTSSHIPWSPMTRLRFNLMAIVARILESPALTSKIRTTFLQCYKLAKPVKDVKVKPTLLPQANRLHEVPSCRVLLRADACLVNRMTEMHRNARNIFEKASE